MKILLDYVFPITIIQPVPAASTAFLKQVCVVAKPALGQEAQVGQAILCTNKSQVEELTNNTDAEKLFDAGMTRVFILLANDLNLATFLEASKGEYFTLLISSDFNDADITNDVVTVPDVKASVKLTGLNYISKLAGELGNTTSVEYVDTNVNGEASVTVVGSSIIVSIEAGVTENSTIQAAIIASAPANALVSTTIDAGEGDNTPPVTATTFLAGGVDAVMGLGDALNIGTFDGVVGVATPTLNVAKVHAPIKNRSVFHVGVTTSFANMFTAFGKLLSNQANWLNNQYAEMPVNDQVNELGDANLFFDQRICFVIHDDEFGNRLGLFVAGGRAIVAPYIIKNLNIDLQSRTLQWITMNQPQYTVREAALLEARLNEDVIQNYIDRQWLESGNITVTLRDQNFVAHGEINVPEPKALWRVFGELRQAI